MELLQDLRDKVYEYSIAPHSGVVRFSLRLNNRLHRCSQHYLDRPALSLFLVNCDKDLEARACLHIKTTFWLQYSYHSNRATEPAMRFLQSQSPSVLLKIRKTGFDVQLVASCGREALGS
jgi:hypothetical protein